MIIDKPKQKPKHRNMQLSEADIDQLAVFDELIAESLIRIAKIKTVQRYLKVDNKVQMDEATKQIYLIDYTHEKLKIRKNVVNYNKYRKAKKAFVKSLEKKNV